MGADYIATDEGFEMVFRDAQGNELSRVSIEDVPEDAGIYTDINSGRCR
jgi:hypothetical protein